MWLFLPNGFLSVVQHKDHPGVLIARGRIKGDIEPLLPVGHVTATPDHDYAYKAYLDRDTVAGAIAYHVANIRYPAFKPSVVDQRRLPVYLKIWNLMEHMQHDFADKPVMQGSFKRTRSGKLVLA
jgi:hypothetical protein